MKRIISCFLLLIWPSLFAQAADFHALVKNGELQSVRRQISRDKILVNMKDEIGRSPLHIAVISGHLAVVNVLIKAGAEVNAAERFKNLTPLHYAALYNFPKIMLFLLSRGAVVNACDNDGNSALHYAAANGCRTTVEILLQHQAMVNIYNRQWQTPLHFCAYAGQDIQRAGFVSKQQADFIEVARLLLQAGANPSMRDIWQNMPESIAWQNSPEKDFAEKFSELVRTNGR